MQKHVHLVDLVKSFPTNVYLQNLAAMQPRMSPSNFVKMQATLANVAKLELAALPNFVDRAARKPVAEGTRPQARGPRGREPQAQVDASRAPRGARGDAVAVAREQVLPRAEAFLFWT